MDDWDKVEPLDVRKDDQTRGNGYLEVLVPSHLTRRVPDPRPLEPDPVRNDVIFDPLEGGGVDRVVFPGVDRVGAGEEREDEVDQTPHETGYDPREDPTNHKG